MDPFGADQAVIELGLEAVEQVPRDCRICLRIEIAAAEQMATLVVTEALEVIDRIAKAEVDRPRWGTFQLTPHPSTRPSSSRSRKPVQPAGTRRANAVGAVPKT